MSSLRDSWQSLRVQRQQEFTQRQIEVQELLSGFSSERQVQAAQLRSELSQFQQNIRTITQSLLAATHQQRQIQAQQLTHDLQVFRSELSVAVAELIEAYSEKRCHEKIQIMQELAAYSEKRCQDKIQIMQELTVYVDDLRADVQVYLSEMESMRGRQAEQVWSELQRNRESRLADVEALFRELADFRAELTSYCASIRESVWGTESLPVVQQPIQDKRPAAKPESSNKAQTKNARVAPTPKAAPLSKLAIASPSDKKTVPASAPIAQPIAAPKSSAHHQLAPLEQEIYKYIRKLQGARLPEIETALGINRFQAVDALRALIKEGVITQRDRVYLIQEEISL